MAQIPKTNVMLVMVIPISQHLLAAENADIPVIFHTRKNSHYVGTEIEGIIEGDQIEVAVFYLESCAYLTGLVTANHNAGSNSARARRLIQI